MMARIYFTTVLFLLGTLLQADSLTTFTVTVPRLKETHSAFEVYERNRYDRPIARAECGQEVSLAPDRYNVRIIEESKRGLREIWRYDVETIGTTHLKAKFGPPTVRVQIIDNPSIGVPPTVVFRSTLNHPNSYTLPVNSYTRIPTGTYTVEVISDNIVVWSTSITIERELNGVLQTDRTVLWMAS
jgi:hypothetical protein